MVKLHSSVKKYFVKEIKNLFHKSYKFLHLPKIYWKMNNQNKNGVLISASSNIKSELDVFFFKESGRPKLRTVYFQNDILVSSDYLGQNIGVFERSGRTIKTYNRETTLKSSVLGKLDMNCLALYKDVHIFAGGNKGNIHVFDLRKEKYLKSFNTNSEKSIVNIELTIDNRNIFSVYSDGTVSKLEIKNKNVNHLTWISGQVSCIKSCPWAVNKLLLGFLDGSVNLYDVNSERKLFASVAHTNKVNCVSYSYHNELLAMSGGNDKQIVLYNINEKTPMKTLKTSSPVTSCSMSEGVFFSFGEENGTITVYDIRNLKKAIFSHKSDSKINYLQFSFDSFLKNTKDTDSFQAFSTSSCSVSKALVRKSNYNCSVASCFSEYEGCSVYGKFDNTSNESLDISSYGNHGKPISEQSNSRNENSILEGVQLKFQDLASVNSQRNSSVVTVESDNQQSELDMEYISHIYKEVLDEELLKASDRLENKIIMDFIDRLGIMEQNIDTTMQPILAEYRELMQENQTLINKLKNSGRF